MKWLGGKRREPEQIHVPAVTFVCEQDGETEREFKRRLLDRFKTSTTLRQAYLVRAKYGESQDLNVVLVLDANPGGHKMLREQAFDVFWKMFNSASCLGILFLREEQRKGITAVAKPFYQR